MKSSNIIKIANNQLTRVENAVSITNKLTSGYLVKGNIFYSNDHEIPFKLIQQIVEKDDKYAIVGRSYSLEETFKMIKESGANILFTDDQMPNTDIVNDLNKIKKLHPELKIIISSWGATDKIIEKYIYQIDGYIDFCSHPEHHRKVLESTRRGANLFIKTIHCKSKPSEVNYFETQIREEFVRHIKSNL
jgi:DNA-binding NarL/FixJ family response regulator